MRSTRFPDEPDLFFMELKPINFKLLDMKPLQSSRGIKIEKLFIKPLVKINPAGTVPNEDIPFETNKADKNNRDNIENLTDEERIIQIHSHLKPIWEEIKKNLDHYRENLTNRPKPISEIPFRMNFHSGLFDCTEAHDVFKFMSLLNQVPLNLFRFCQSSYCDTWFASKKSNKFYCSLECRGRSQYKDYRRDNLEKEQKRQKLQKRKEYREKTAKKIQENLAKG